MHFPHHWIRLHQDLEPGVVPGQVDAWGWSDVSVADATRVAGERLARAVDAARAGSLNEHGPNWYYPRTPLRENIVRQVGADALVTRNRYGALVLNSPSLFIADIDLPEVREPRAAGTSVLGRLFGRKQSAPPPPDPALEALAPVRAFAATNPSAGVRAYRTSAGLRVIVTGVDLPAGSHESRTLLEQFGSDPLYVALSANYASYRARLTPKPWRCGMWAAAHGWVAPGQPVDHNAFAPQPDWLVRYEKASAPYAVCRLIETFGPMPSGDELAVIDAHDRACRVDSGLPLA